MAAWVGRYFQWHVAESYPLNFVWPISTVCAAIILDWLLMKTKSFILTSLIGGPIWALLVWAFNYIPLAPFLQPVHFMNHVLTVSDVQGIAIYIRSRTRISTHTSNAARCGVSLARLNTFHWRSVAPWRWPDTGSANSSEDIWQSGRSAATSKRCRAKFNAHAKQETATAANYPAKHNRRPYLAYG